MTSRHATIRAKQRGIPAYIDQILDRYGQREYDGHGAFILYFNKRSFRNMERSLGKEPVNRILEWRDAYKVVCTSDGDTVTIGHRFKRIWRK